MSATLKATWFKHSKASASQMLQHITLNTRLP